MVFHIASAHSCRVDFLPPPPCLITEVIIKLITELISGLTNMLERPYLTLGKEKAPHPCSKLMSRVELETDWLWLL